jgi:uncharacterized protein (TIGR00290 family)
MKKKAIVSWSGGEDCTLALWHARAPYDVIGLLVTVTCEYRRVSMHGVRIELIEEQAHSLGLPLRQASISRACGNDEYEHAMKAALDQAYSEGVEAVICGDLFLEDVRRYREEKLLRPGTGVFPLWGMPTRDLARQFLSLGFRATLCCVDTQTLDGSFAGRRYDETLLADLPAHVDPCGENGEFHTFVHDGPSFGRPVALRCGERVLRDGRFMYCELFGGAQWRRPAGLGVRLLANGRER